MTTPLLNRPRLAVLVDAENIAARHADPVLKRAGELGSIAVRRVYADWSQPAVGGWREPATRHAFVAIQQFQLATGKNGTDCALIVDAMDLLHSGKVEGVCLVSSDCDFTRLACRLRESGLMVYGFGERKTPAAFVNACDRFTAVEDLAVSSRSDPQFVVGKVHPSFLREPQAPARNGSESDGGPIRSVQAEAPGALGSPRTAPVEVISMVKTAAPLPASSLPKVPMSQLERLLRSAFEDVVQPDGWASLTSLGSALRKRSPDFQPKTHGHAGLSKLVNATPCCRIKRTAHPRNPSAEVVWVKVG